MRYSPANELTPKQASQIPPGSDYNLLRYSLPS